MSTQHIKPFVLASTTTDTFADIGSNQKPAMQIYAIGIVNSGSNALDYRILGSVDSTTFPHILAAGTIPAGGNEIYRDNQYITAVKLQAKSSTISLPTTISACFTGLAY